MVTNKEFRPEKGVSVNFSAQEFHQITLTLSFLPQERFVVFLKTFTSVLVSVFLFKKKLRVAEFNGSFFKNECNAVFRFLVFEKLLVSNFGLSQVRVLFVF